MNREMLLENNNIHFEPKVQNIRQMASKLFSSSEEPLVDDLPFTVFDINVNAAMHSDNNETDTNWTDVKEIFDNFNKPIITSQTTVQNKEIFNKHEDGFPHKLISDPNSKIHGNGFNMEKKPSIVDTVGALKSSPYREIHANKENIEDSVDRRASNSVESSYKSQFSGCSEQGNKIKSKVIQLKNENTLSSEQDVFSISVSSLINLNEAPITNDHSNRVRQVNVEMFAVSLKRMDLSEHKSAKENQNS